MNAVVCAEIEKTAQNIIVIAKDKYRPLIIGLNLAERIFLDNTPISDRVNKIISAGETAASAVGEIGKSDRN